MNAQQWNDQAQRIDDMRDEIASNRILWAPEFKAEFDQALAKLDDLSNLVWEKAVAAEKAEQS